MSDGRRSPLVSAAVLADRLAGPVPPALLDVRWRLGATAPELAAEHDASHLPGASWVDLDRDLAGPPGRRGRHPLPDVGVFAAAMRRAGVGRTRPVTVYDDGGGMSAARAWWLLEHHGHPDVTVLDGGLRAWREAGLPLESGPVTPTPGDFEAGPGRRALLEAGGVAALAASGVLLDARAGERYRGDVEPVDPVAGHIPGARSAPTSENLGVDGRFLPAAELRRRFMGLGVGAGMPVAAYCGSGVTAAHEVLALEVAGIPAALYAGSWSEWVADPGRPVAMGGDGGAAPGR